MSFYPIVKEKNSVKIFMSATGNEMKKILYKVSKTKRIKYHYSLPVTFQNIKSLTFFSNTDTFETLIEQFVSRNEKAIFFIQSCEKAYELYHKYQNESLFLCSKSNGKHKDDVNLVEIEKMLKKECFEKRFLITTSCFDAGANIIDTELTNIVVDIKDVSSLIQCVGRKRCQGADDKFNLYIKEVTNSQLGGLISAASSRIKKADYLRQTNPQEYVLKYAKDPDQFGIVYDDVNVNSHKNSTTKKINWLKYWKNMFDIKLYSKMLKLGKYGYCQYISNYFGFASQYDVLNEDYSINTFLQKMVDDKIVMLTKPDRT